MLPALEQMQRMERNHTGCAAATATITSLSSKINLDTGEILVNELLGTRCG